MAELMMADLKIAAEVLAKQMDEWLLPDRVERGNPMLSSGPEVYAWCKMARDVLEAVGRG